MKGSEVCLRELHQGWRSSTGCRRRLEFAPPPAISGRSPLSCSPHFTTTLIRFETLSWGVSRASICQKGQARMLRRSTARQHRTSNYHFFGAAHGLARKELQNQTLCFLESPSSRRNVCVGAPYQFRVIFRGVLEVA